ncbi:MULTISPECIES: hypothetical protein [Thermomonosporaceae]|uniref:hypothetical protein n=1 Tax=Thermomonosporaceae TaxID=2012 RepID=UPI00255A7811|nr:MULTISPECIES: hypothetical protein [Thermomonosporaceae]MDL4777698.1 hypothetical protein [Actinomadura xylanilytica]
MLVAAGLVVDAVVHWRFAPDMAYVEGGAIGGDLLFRVQGVVAAVVAVLVLVAARRWSYALAFLVAASAAGALLLYYFVDVGALWPLPDMHEPVWYSDKTISLAGEGVAALAALAGLLTVRGKRSSREPENAARL